MKKLVVLFAAALLLINAGTAFALTYQDFDAFYTVGSSSSTTVQNSFSLDQTPWLYMKLPEAGWNIGLSLWVDPDNSIRLTFPEITKSAESWISLSNWDSVKQHGTWKIFGEATQFRNCETYISLGKTSFTVTPEPISALLFIIGGGILVARRRCRP